MINEAPVPYLVEVDMKEDAVITEALAILDRRMKRPGEAMSSPTVAKNFFRLRLSELPHEEFWVLWLNAQNEVLHAECLSRGTISAATVYPREVVKRALEINAAAAIIAHNHPSGAASPSRADESLTQMLRDALKLVDVRILDHFIVGMDEVMSFAEKGLI